MMYALGNISEVNPDSRMVCVVDQEIEASVHISNM